MLPPASLSSLLILCMVSTLESVFALDKIYLCNSATSFDELTIPHYFMRHNASQRFRTSVRDMNCSSEPEVISTARNGSGSDASFYFLRSGDIEIPSMDYFLREEFCISRFETDLIEVKHCPVECGVTHTCIQKCCPPSEIVDFSNEWAGSLCTASNVSWMPVFYDTHEGCGSRTASPVNFHLIPLSESHVDSAFLQPYRHIRYKQLQEGDDVVKDENLEGSRFRLMEQGHLMVQGVEGRWLKINQGEFCIDGMTGYFGSSPFQGDLQDQVFLDRSYDEEEADFDDSQPGRLEPLYITLMIIGAVFLFSTSLLYLLIWEKHNIHGWTIFAFVTTMLFMYIFLAMSFIFYLSVYHEFGGTGACKTVGILAHFFYLSTMCWLTVINVDLWLTFRNVKPGGGRNRNAVRFCLYALFAFGIPVVVVGSAVILDHVYSGAFGNGSECEPPVILPLYGKEQCYIQKNAYWPYLYIPMSILISCNILTFSSTVFTLCLYRNHTRAVASAGHQKESVMLFGKLFIVAGISWVHELISSTSPGPWWLWLVFDAYNLLQAVLIFIIFALKRENILWLYHKYPRARSILLPIMRTPCCYTNSFDPERTEMTGLPQDFRNSRMSFRRGSNLSTSAMVSNSSNGNFRARRGSDDY